MDGFKVVPPQGCLCPMDWQFNLKEIRQTLALPGRHATLEQRVTQRKNTFSNLFPR